MAMSYPGEREETLKSKVYKKYKYDIFPRIDHIRGTTRLKDTLEKLAQLGTPKISEADVERISDKEWDNLIILDAARYDTYKETINPEADHRITAESHSRGFIRENFSEGDWSDTVVITANPFYNDGGFEELTGKNASDKFPAVFQVWNTDWDQKNSTVMPEKVIEKAHTAEKLFPNKRKIIHFMQPHYPFVKSDIGNSGFEDAVRNEDIEDVWVKAEKGKVEPRDVVDAYKENLSFVFSKLDKLEVSGKTIITADHGNFLGENGLWGHPGDSNAKVLREVPWEEL